jgi:hypothetical protein
VFRRDYFNIYITYYLETTQKHWGEGVFKLIVFTMVIVEVNPSDLVNPRNYNISNRS